MSSAVPPAFTAVIGSGEVRRAAEAFLETAGGIPVDIASDGKGGLWITEARERQILLFGSDVLEQPPPPEGNIPPQAAFPIPEALAAETDFVTGIAYDRGRDRLYVFNATAARVGVFDDAAFLLSAFDVDLPNLEEDPAAEPEEVHRQTPPCACASPRLAGGRCRRRCSRACVPAWSSPGEPRSRPDG